jgi:hypothetical protein
VIAVIVRNERLNSLEWTKVYKELRPVGFTSYGSGIWGKHYGAMREAETKREAEKSAQDVKNLLRSWGFGEMLDNGRLCVVVYAVTL